MRIKLPRPELTDVDALVSAGGYVLSFSRAHGALVDPAGAQVANLVLRPAPEPEPFELFGRKDELRTIRAALRAQRRVAVSGPPGCGKTALLRTLQFEGRTIFTGGTRYFSARHIHGFDIVQLAFQNLFEPLSPSVVVLPGEAWVQCKSIQAFLLIDDVEDDADVEKLIALFAGSMVLLAYRQPKPDTISIPNLPHEDAALLFQRELRGAGQAGSEERHVLQEIARHLGGNPRRLVALSGAVRERSDVSLARLLSETSLLTDLAAREIKTPRERITADELASELATAAFEARPADVVQLGPRVADPLAQAGHWVAWAKALDLIRRAATSEGDTRLRAWTLHQTGVRLACLGEKDAAKVELEAARSQRLASGDRVGVDVTEYVLKTLFPDWKGAAAIDRTEELLPKPKRRLPSALVLSAFAALIVAGCVFGAYSYFFGPRVSLTIIELGGGLNLCYHAKNVTQVTIEQPLEKELGARATDCIPWQRPGRNGGTVVFAARVRGALGLTATATQLRVFAGNPPVAKEEPPAAPAVAVSAAPVPVAPSAAATIVGSDSTLVSAVRTYYQEWNDRQFSNMWQLLSPAFHARISYDSWLKQHDFDRSIRVSDATVTGDRQVSATVVAVDAGANGQTITNTYRLTWTLVPANGGWLLDSYKQ